LAKDINDHSRQLLRYAIELIEYRQITASERAATANANEKATEMSSSRRRELHALYDSSGLREQIRQLLEKLALYDIPPTPHLLCLIALLDSPAWTNVYNLFKTPEQPWEGTGSHRVSAAVFVAQKLSSGCRPNAAEIARTFNVDPRTVRRWFNDPEFRALAGWKPA
jgi:hypothetical protein